MLITQIVFSQSTSTLDSDSDGISDIVDLDDDNDGILDVNEGYCESKSIYELDISETLSNTSSVGRNGGTINLIYKLISGPIISSIGSQFTVPFIYSDFNNTANGANQEWNDVLESNNGLSLVPDVSTFYSGVPSNNLQEEQNDLADGLDSNIKALLDKGRIDLLGNFTISIGDLPVVTDQRYSVYDSESFMSLFSVFNVRFYDLSKKTILSLYHARPVLQNEINSTESSSTIPLNVPFGDSYVFNYTAFIDKGAEGSPALNKGLVTLKNGKVTFCTHKDTDNDGIPNYLDLDSDGDGCPDAIEGGAGFVNKQLVRANMPGGNSSGSSDYSGSAAPVTVNLGDTVETTSGSDSLGVPTIAGSGQGLGTSQDKESSDICKDSDEEGVNDHADLDNDKDGVNDSVDLDDDNDGILDVNEGYCESKSIYELDISETLSNTSSVGRNGGTINLIYKLISGPMISSIGSKFTVPFIYSDFNNTANGANQEWNDVLKSNNGLSLVPDVSTFYSGLPSNNLQEEQNDLAEGLDANIKALLDNGRIDLLGNFTISIGDLPVVTDQRYSVDDSESFMSLFSVFNARFYELSNTIMSLYHARPVLQNVIRSTRFASTIPLDVPFGDSYMFNYTAFIDKGAQGARSLDRGLVTLRNGKVTFCTHKDTDNDGVPNYLDLDSDGDGCPDSVEAYKNNDAAGGDSGIYGKDTPTIANKGVNSKGLVIAAGINASNDEYIRTPSQTNIGGKNTFEEGVAVVATDLDNETVCINGTAKFSSTLSVSPIPITNTKTVIGTTTANVINYRWQVSTDGTNFNDITKAGTAPVYSGFSGTTTSGKQSILNLSNVPLSVNKYKYRLVVTHEANICGVEKTATLFVNNPIANAGSDFTKTCTSNSNGAVIGTTKIAGYSYSWHPMKGLTDVSISNPTANPESTTTYKVTVTDASGCTNTDEVVVTVIDDTTAPVTPTIAAVTFECSGTPATPTTTDACDTNELSGVSETKFPITKLGTTTVTWTFTDASGNEITADQTVIVKDTKAPVTPTIAAATFECSGTPATPTTTDACDTNKLSGVSETKFPITKLGTTTVTWTFTDASGNKTTADQTVIVKDTTAPITPTIAAVTFECSGTPATPTTTDACDTNKLSGVSETKFPITKLGDTTVTWTFTDASGNKTTADQTVIVKDTTAPITPTIAVATFECSGTPATPTTTDVCDTNKLSGVSETKFPITKLGTTTVTWTFTDASGNKTTADQTVIVKDTTAPITPTIAAVTFECSGTPATPTTTDACDTNKLSGVSETKFPITKLGTTTVTWTFTDASGNEITADQTVIVKDTKAPVTPTIAAATFECSGTPATPTTTDACDTNKLSGVSETKFPITKLGTTTVTWTFTDASGNKTTADQTVIVKDTTAPITPTIAAVTFECSGTPATPTTTDACDTNKLSGVSETKFPITKLGDTTVTWTFTDASGNKTTADQTVIVKDTTAPITPTIAAVTFECSGTPATPTTTDACDTNKLSGVSETKFPITKLGTTTVTWTFTDASGNETTADQTVIVKDTTAPITPTIAAVTFECSGTPATPTTTDACDTNKLGGVSETKFPITKLGDTTVTWTFTDASGNKTTADQTVIVKDTTAPITPTIAAVTFECSGTPATPTTTDACDTNKLSGVSETKFPITKLGDTTVTWTFTDASGNKTTADQTVIVKDTTAPITPTIAAATFECSGTPATPTTTDVCDTNKLSGVSETKFPITKLGTTTVTWTFTDASGNKTTADQTVIVKDTTAPITPTIAAATFECSGTPAIPTTTDACDTNELSGVSETKFPITKLGTTTVTWTFTDASGNKTTADQTVIVKDTTAPITLTIAAATFECSGTPATPTTTDVCDTNKLSGVSETKFPITKLGTTTVTWTFTDASGNKTTADQTVIVKDTIAPITPTIAAVTFECSGTPATPTTTDACDTNELSGVSEMKFPITKLGTTTVTRTFTDASGNETTALQTVKVQGTIDTDGDGLTDCEELSGIDDSSTTAVTKGVSDPNNICDPLVLAPSCDADNDGIPNKDEDLNGDGDFTNDDSDNDGIPNYLDNDDDNDGIPNKDEDLNGDGDFTNDDSDNDGIPNYLDNDDDNDGIPNKDEDLNGDGDFTNDDSDNDGIPNYLDNDDDNDGIPNKDEDLNGDGDFTNDDSDNDGIPNYLDNDDDNDGIPNKDEDLNGDGDLTNDDSDNDGIPNYLDNDDDNDGIPNKDEDLNGDGNFTNDDSDNDGIPNYLDNDDDNDGIPNKDEDLNGDGDFTNDDSDNDGIPNYLDNDDDNDGIPNKDEDLNGDGDFTNDDSDNDGIPNYLDNDEVELFVYNIISPNNDGVNDVLKIENIKNYPKNTLLIYNRWGGIVFSASEYGHKDNLFSGVSKGRAVVDKGVNLPVGTYFYYFTYLSKKTRKEETLKGWLYIQN